MTFVKIDKLPFEDEQYNIGMHCNTCKTGTVVQSIFFTDQNIQVKCTRCKNVQYYGVEYNGWD